MWLIWNILSIFLIFVQEIYSQSGCPFAKDYKDAQNLFHQIQIKDEKLDADFLLLNGEIGSSFFVSDGFTNEISDFYNKTLTLIIAEQLFANKLNDKDFISYDDKLELLNSQRDCVPKVDRCRPNQICSNNDSFRTITGSCNNKLNSNWGAQYTSYARFAPPAHYNDGIYEISKSISGKDLPLVREIGNKVLQANPFKVLPKEIGNFGSFMYGQFMAHDMGFRQFIQSPNPGPAAACCSKENHLLPKKDQHFGCNAIEIPLNDPILAPMNITCLEYIRTQSMFPNDCSLEASRPVSSVTQFLDLSIIYGSDEAVAKTVRSFKDGKLLISHNVLPETPNCDQCYFAGDTRALGTSTLAQIHSIYYRLHNIIATDLKKINKHWNDERLYEESRRIAIALHQHIIYNEWLPHFVSYSENFECQNTLYCGEYDPFVDPSSFTEFSHSAFAQFHLNVPVLFNLRNKDFQINHSLHLASPSAEAVSLLETNYVDILRGGLTEPVQFNKFNVELRNNAFNGNNVIGIDLLSIDLMKGRDHGHHPYYIYRNICAPDYPIKNWNDLVGLFSDKDIAKLKETYSSVFDIDLYVGLNLELRFGTYLGPTATCIAVEQFKRKKYGDSYFYSFPNGPKPFLPKQLQEIKRFTFAKLYCIAVPDIHEMLINPLVVPTETNKFIDCNLFGRLNLEAWKEKPTIVEQFYF